MEDKLLITNESSDNMLNYQIDKKSFGRELLGYTKHIKLTLVTSNIDLCSERLMGSPLAMEGLLWMS